MGDLADDTTTATQNANSLSPHDEGKAVSDIKITQKYVKVANPLEWHRLKEFVWPFDQYEE